MAVVDLAAVVLSVAFGYYLRFETELLPLPEEYHPFSNYIQFTLLEAVVFVAVFTTQGMYVIRRNASRIDELQTVAATVAVGALLSVGIVAFTQRDFGYSRAVVALSWGCAVFLIWGAHLTQFWLHGRLRRLGWGTQRLLVVGAGEIAQAVLDKIRNAPDWGYQVAGYVADEEAHGPIVGETPRLGRLSEVAEVVHRHQITEVILAEPEFTRAQILDVVQMLDTRQVSIKVFPDVFQLISSQVIISDLNGLPLVSVRDAALRGWRFTVKRMVDVVVSAVVLVLLSPFLLFIALIIKLTSPKSPVFYVQERVGLNGRPFWVIKFRSMRPDAEEVTGPIWAARRDPRATLLGRFLRRYSLDELPQFINVLLGDMSVVGPRPERPHFVEQFSQRIPNYWARHREKAGLTGWAQVNGLRGETSIEERTAYDLWYVENWNLWLDFKIMLRTIPALFRDTNG